MSDSNDESINQFVGISAEAQRLLEEIKQLRAQAEEQFKAAEESRKKADSEGLFAFNAKRACEEHATAISHFKGTVEVDINSIAAAKQRSDELVAAVNTAKASVDSDSKGIGDNRKEIAQATQELKNAVAATTTQVQAIDASKQTADTTLKAINDALTASTDARSKTEAAQKKTEEISTAAADLAVKTTANHQTSSSLSAEIGTQLAAANTTVEAINRLLQDSRTLENALRGVFQHVSQADQRALEYEAQITKLSAELKDLTNRTESLLPGATSASLASSFNKQQLRFKSPKKQWEYTFIACIGALVVFGFPSFLSLVRSNTPESWEEIVRSLAMRLPVVIPLVWLGIYAARNYMLSIRLEEDYAYKEAISIAFEGYKREMEKIEPEKEALSILCNNVLRAIAERPGRIYEGKNYERDITPLNELRNAAEKVADKLGTKSIAAQ